MKSLFTTGTLALLFWLGAFLPGHAQQILRERVLSWPNTQDGFVATDLLQLQPDSLRLLGDFQASNSSTTGGGGLQPIKTSLRRVRPVTCDTLPVPGAAFTTQGFLYTSAGLVTRQGRVLISNSSVNAPNLPVTLHLLNRDGSLRWQQSLLLTATYGEVGGLLEAPDQGFFVAIRTETAAYLVRLDSLGNKLWQRVVGRGLTQPDMYAPVYARSNNILLHSSYFVRNIGNTTCVIELSQNGDTLSRQQTSPDPQQLSMIDANNKGSLLPLRDGGFLVAASVDSANKGYFRPFLTRLDQNLNVVWSTIYRQQGTQQYRFSHPYELADGSLVVLSSSAFGGTQRTYYLFQYSASGTLLQRYAFTSPLIASLLQTGTGTSGPGFNTPSGLQPLSDSTFLLVSNLRAYVANKQVQRTYLAHIKVAGLRLVVNSAYIPAANSPLAARPGTGSTWPAPAYPNPASASLTVPLPALTGAARLTLRDLLGRPVRTQALAPGTGAATVTVGGLAAGVYLLSLERAGQAPAVQRLTVSGP